MMFAGRKKVILKSDGGAAIAALKNAVEVSGEVDMGVEMSPVGDSSYWKD